MLKYFLGSSPRWFKLAMIAFLIINIFTYYLLGPMGPMITAWLFIGEFIFTLAMALKCYPLQSGGILALEALILGLTSPEAAYEEVDQNLEVVLLLVFMVAGIYFMKPMLMYIFSKVFTKIKSKVVLSMLFVFLAAVLSAFLDALTVTAVLISVAVGFYGVYHKIHSMENADYDEDQVPDRQALSGETLEQFRSFLRSLIMHGVVGTALGGVCTLVGEPQNLLIGEKMGWEFVEFFQRMAPITIPVLIAGLLTTFILEKTKIFGFGAKLPDVARGIIENYTKEVDEKRTKKETYGLWVQGISAILLILSLALHLAPVGFIGLFLIVVQTAFMGITDEHSLGKAFEEALPFTGLLVVFFVIVAMIHDQHLFTPIIDYVLTLPVETQPSMFYLANGILSMISDNVFVATVYINEVEVAYTAGNITREQFNHLAVAINTGTNLPSVATPNGQAAFLFLLTSSLAPLINLSYGKMVKMALPYTIVLGGIGLLGVYMVL
ncbi:MULTISPECIES: sodium/proton antiporter NhaB [unclassified Leeuwenhoekiella]|uniref:sodium/proton antiporter NhaB n=1 Tax=unclassified Leeuwenhoekiella TaxID=2615029 RepID=UPI000C694BAE|nr:MULTISPECIES: sodium/proton antiporter NhaB [unclassified Leeuwenhoekiella]MAW96440.1 sodium/proton antiporter NhaB [Leeuwenhoekiella sp.]MBA81327.1 sodium/proton antiporter NhaB [Leeuwenhoekiella sp.]|tara:strand:+ start:7616 stop:9097 length:1482 start_codon:yes stop_codon:yes gene_type:complete